MGRFRSFSDNGRCGLALGLFLQLQNALIAALYLVLHAKI
jgi:hypothetical protein